MNINVQGIANPFFGATSVLSHRGLKSTEEKMERQAKRDNQVAFYENQKENLKKMECSTVEEIARKLDMLHSYEDQIAAVKAAYNSEQMWHILDEAKEVGEKIAEAAEKLEPKTPEERVEELVEEAMGTDEDGGVLEEVMEDAAKIQEELEEEMQEELQGELQEEIQESLQEGVVEESQGDLQENLQADLQEELQDKLQQDIQEQETEEIAKQRILSEELRESVWENRMNMIYQPIDVKL